MIKTSFMRSLRYRILRFLIQYPGQMLLNLLFSSCKIKVKNLECLNKAKENHILMLWHNRLVFIPYFLRKFAKFHLFSAVISNSRDGDLLADIVDSDKQGKSIRVSHTKRHEAARAMMSHLKDKRVLIITPDGPRGPLYKMKKGVAFTAKQTGAYILAISWSSDRYWQLKTWDKMQIPKPFSNIQVVIEKPVICTGSLEEETVKLESLLNETTKKSCL